MTFRHAMTVQTQGISVIAPLRWRAFEGIVADYWHAQAGLGAGGYYVSPDPRMMVFLDDVSARIRITNRETDLGAQDRPMARVLYVPAGVPMWSRFTGGHRFRHLDLHLSGAALQHHLAQGLGNSAAQTALRRPIEIDQTPQTDALARLIIEEVSTPRQAPVFTEHLVWALATAVLDSQSGTAPQPCGALQAHQPLGLEACTGQSASLRRPAVAGLGLQGCGHDNTAAPSDRAVTAAVTGGLTGGQIRKLRNFMQLNGHRRVSTHEMAQEVGLSESWFSHVFRQSMGETPQQWQLRLRIERAKELLTDRTQGLSDVATSLGFSDQAHFTRAFRTFTGNTPAAWRRAGATPSL